MGASLLVIGLDGASLDVIEPWVRAGRLPAIGALLARGAFAPLRSTVPPATFPAWTSLMTGVNPGRHGILDFATRVPGTYRVRFVNGSRRRTPALWNRLDAAGRRVAAVTVPATYPPEPVAGVMVSGWDTPLTTAIDGSFVHPPALWPEIRARVGRVPFADFQEVATGPGWHARALESLLDGVGRRTRLVEMLLEREAWDAFVVVFGESDTVSHHFWRFHDPRSPRFAPSPFADAIRRVYEALDAAVGTLVRAVGPGAAVCVVSDHGSGGAGDEAVFLNRRLAECGLLRFGPSRGRVARAARALALRAVPITVQARMLRGLPDAAGRLEGAARFGGIDWGRTLAYSDELDYAPSVRLNVRGREPEGTVMAAAAPEVGERVARALREWRDARGRPVVSRVVRREEVYSGAHVAEAADLFVELAEVDGYTRSCLRSRGPGPTLRRLDPVEFGAGKGAGMNGSHRREGLVVLAGRGVRPAGRLPPAEIVDVLPTLLPLCGLPVPEGLDGRPLRGMLADAPVLAPDGVPERDGAPVDYGAAEAAAVAARLAALGYLEQP